MRGPSGAAPALAVDLALVDPIGLVLLAQVPQRCGDFTAVAARVWRAATARDALLTVT